MDGERDSEIREEGWRKRKRGSERDGNKQKEAERIYFGIIGLSNYISSHRLIIFSHTVAYYLNFVQK